ncbi:MAG: hypothetical protein E7589_03255 [Ruminococcaceae bacterium]|nr:hypothetical protein [Oscillospiraceae bacterium]
MFKRLYPLYRNIATKIRKLAIILFIVDTILSIITGALFLIDALFLDGDIFGGELWWIGLLTIVFGSLISWICTWLLYGYGVLIDAACDNARISARAYISYLKKNKSTETEYRQEIWRLYDDCLITQAEYNRWIVYDINDRSGI